MNKQDIVRKVSQKLGIDESIVEAVFINQTQQINESLSHPDRNEIFLPELGTITLKVSKATDKLSRYMRSLDWVNKRLSEDIPEKLFNHLQGKRDKFLYITNILKWKVSLVCPKYNGIRMRPIENSLKYYNHGVFVDFINKLRKLREDELNKKDFIKQKKALAKQGGNNKSLSTLPFPDDSQ